MELEFENWDDCCGDSEYIAFEGNKFKVEIRRNDEAIIDKEYDAEEIVKKVNKYDKLKADLEKSVRQNRDLTENFKKALKVIYLLKPNTTVDKEHVIELIEFAESIGIEKIKLKDKTIKCIKCDSENIAWKELESWENELNIDGLKLCRCKDCDCIWTE